MRVVDGSAAASASSGRTTTSPTRGGEQRGEAAAEGVGEDQRADDERDAEDDRERAHQQAHLAPEQALEGGAEHQSLASTAASSGSSPRGPARGRGCAARRRCGRRRGRRRGRCTPRRPGRGSPSRSSGRGRRRCGAAARAPPRPNVESRLPVGSSAKTIRGRLTSARATATRCCWPPRELVGLVLEPVARARPSRSPSRTTPGRACGRAIASGSTMFSSAVSVGTRLKDWKTNPISSRRSRVSALSLSAELLVADEHRPGVGGVERGAAVHQRRLARPARPHDRGELPGGQVEAHVVERAHHGCPCRRSWSGRTHAGRRARRSVGLVMAARLLPGQGPLPGFGHRRP